MRSTAVFCLLVVLAGCGKSAQEIEAANNAEGLRLLAKRQADLRESDRKFLAKLNARATDVKPEDGASTKK